MKAHSPLYVTTVSLLIIFFVAGSGFAQSISDSSLADPAEIQRELEAVKAEMETPNRSRQLLRRYEQLLLMLNNCETRGPAYAGMPDFMHPLAPEASLCINGSLSAADPDYNRVLAASTGTGIGTGAPGNCSLSGTGTAVNYDVYSFNLTGCAVFPTEVTITLCGPAGCSNLGNVDTVLSLYRNVPAGDPLTANGGLPAVFNPASPCTNARAAQDDLGTTAGTTNNPGGSTCNQVVGTNCVGPCAGAGALSGFRRQVGNGRFTVVIAGFGNTTIGNYNLYVDAPGAGCILALAPTAAGATLGGRISTASGNGIRGAVVTLSGGNLPEPRTALTSSFGYYNFENLEAGSSYILTVSSKRFTFANPTRVINLLDNVTDADFVSEE